MVYRLLINQQNGEYKYLKKDIQQQTHSEEHVAALFPYGNNNGGGVVYQPGGAQHTWC